MEVSILFSVALDFSKHRCTNAVIHSDQTGILPPPQTLQIAKYPDDTGSYLFYLDKDGIEQTDTYHDSLDAAFAQAELEFGVKPEEWTTA
ncbi:hypothetical protein [Conchiformibius kuhniae]|uniref:Uncharacterized protein n=1 Tax=Conchiformibius kuhniae TaxID=211502 RepID=A0A8T9MZ92_9NEIS